MADEFGEKTELPTEHRLTEARESGRVAKSVDLNAAGVILMATAALYFGGTWLMTSLSEVLYGHLAGPAWLQIDSTRVISHFWAIAYHLSGAGLMLLGMLMLAAISLNLLQFGFLVSTEAFTPKWSHINPLQGLQRIFSWSSVIKLMIGLGKLALLAIISYFAIRAELPALVMLNTQIPSIILTTTGQLMGKLAFQLSAALVVMALIDFAYQKWKYLEDMKMTKQEVREEMKQMEGDPQHRARRRDAHQKLVSARDLQKVRDADVVITNPTEIAVAIKYDPEKMAAPAVVAKGQGEIAARIRRIAIEEGIPIIERKPLARALFATVKVGHPIPLDMYEVFVEIMAYVYRLTGRQLPKM
ncbi:MAG: flagellar biosynthesis protein FlhB [Planctomycetota bacterium]|nr:flagellar biosynthesis protein FlhB [Planctomycetota bacterium]MDA1211080.1 flagellar biosynthesis protein FlhB [Planctomycetota bacterium]